VTSSPSNHRQSAKAQVICLILCGLTVGWLIGLSISPILSIVVASILTLVVAAVSAIAGLDVVGPEAKAKAVGQEKNGETTPSNLDSPSPVARTRNWDSRSVSIVPLALFLVGIVLGASLGTYARSHDWLGADPQSVIRKWRVTKLSDDEIAKRLFDQLYPPGNRSGNEGNDNKNGEEGQKSKGNGSGGPNALAGRLTGGLFASEPAEECKELRSAPDDAVARLMQASKNEHVRRFAKRCNDVACLRAAVEELLCTDQQP
jgi:hypothetical protein